MEKKKYEMHLISNTHWDIDYLWSTKETQMMLEDLLDQLIEVFETNPDYKHFHFDGQVFPILDYLETRPDRKEKLIKLIKNGQLLVGPWFTLPDEFLTGGEFLVRNLLRGHRHAEKLGEVLKVGYNIFSFGHISQLPQIYRGFDIDLIIIKRGISPKQTEKVEFLWKSPDGTSVFGHRIGKGGRSNFTHSVYKQVLGLKPSSSLDSKYAPPVWEELSGTVINLCDDHSCDMQHRIHNPQKTYDYSKAVKAAEELKTVIADASHIDTLLLFDGFDNALPYKELTKILFQINQELEDATIKHSSLSSAAKQVTTKLEAVKQNDALEVIEGELRYMSEADYIFPGVNSSRMPIKQKNTEAEIAYQMWAEPFSTFAWLMGKRLPEEYLSQACEEIMINQHHDGITGTHMDRLFLTMMERYENTIDISRTISRRSLEHLCCNIDNSGMDKDDVMLVVFNPLPYKRTEVVKAYIDFFWDREVKSVSIEDFEGKYIACRGFVNGEVRTVVERGYYPAMRPMGMNRHQVFFEAKDIPPMGYKAFKIKKSNKQSFYRGSMATAADCMENEYLKVKIEKNGTLTITHKESGGIFDSIHYFADSGEIGHALFHKAPENNMDVTSLGCGCTIAKLYDSDLTCTYLVTIEMKLPESVESMVVPYGEEGGEEFTPYARSKTSKVLCVKSYITLKKGSKRVDIKTAMDNTIKDHWLRVCFPTFSDVKTSYCEGQFDVNERLIEKAETYEDWTRSHFGLPQINEQPQRWFAGVSNGKTGLAIINKGLPAYRITHEDKKVIELTLLRCHRVCGTKKNSTHVVQPLAQCPGEHVFEYAIYPHSGPWEQADIFKEAYAHNVRLKIAQVRNQGRGVLPYESSFIKLKSSKLVLSCVKRSEALDGMIVRVWNPFDFAIEEELTCFKNIASASVVNLNENEQAVLSVIDGCSVRFTVNAKKIFTVKLKIKGEEGDVANEEQYKLGKEF